MAGYTVAALAEKVNNHIKFFWVSVGTLGLLGGYLFVQLSTLNATVARLDQRIKDIVPNTATSLLKSANTEKEMSESASAASAILRSGTRSKVMPNDKALRDLASEFIKVQNAYPDVPQLWQATAQFINYKSTVKLPASAQKGIAEAQNHSCTLELNVKEQNEVYSNCHIDLEGVGTNYGNGNRILPVIFLNCIIGYHGGTVTSAKLRFINCVFDFDTPAIPPKNALVAMQELTADHGSDIRLEIKGNRS